MIHPYGYTTMRYVASLVSSAMIFCVGSGLSFQHGISGLMHPAEVSYFLSKTQNQALCSVFPLITSRTF